MSAVQRILIFLSTSLTLCLMAGAQCPMNTVIVTGRVKNAVPDSKVRVKLVYPKGKPGEAGEVTVEDESFRIPLEFVTMQSSVFTNLPVRCGRKPKTVDITLVETIRRPTGLPWISPRTSEWQTPALTPYVPKLS